MSGRAINFRIEDRLFPVPLRNVVMVIEETARKAAVFTGEWYSLICLFVS